MEGKELREERRGREGRGEGGREGKDGRREGEREGLREARVVLSNLHYNQSTHN